MNHQERAGRGGGDGDWTWEQLIASQETAIPGDVIRRARVQAPLGVGLLLPESSQVGPFVGVAPAPVIGTIIGRIEANLRSIPVVLSTATIRVVPSAIARPPARVA